jgi:DNA-binding MarR family transcriptional regulator
MLIKREISSQFIEEVVDYIKKTLQIPIQSQPWEIGKKTPLFLRNQYQFFIVNLFSCSYLLIINQSESEQTPVTVRKHIDYIQEKWHIDVIYASSKITSYNRQRLIEQKIQFIVPYNQMYLPLLGLDLREYFKKYYESITSFYPSSQAILFHSLIRKEYEQLTISSIAAKLNYSVMTIHRALDQLEQKGLITKAKRNKPMQFLCKGKELWDKSLPYLTSPVIRRIFLPKEYDTSIMLTAGLSALSEYTMLGSPQKQVFATKSTKWSKEMILLPDNEPEAIEVELWKYDPLYFSDGGIIDRLSLYLTLRDQTDERVIQALSNLMMEMKW